MAAITTEALVRDFDGVAAVDGLDLEIGGGEIYEKPVGWINVAAEGRGIGVHDQLRVVLGYVGARLVDGACIDVPLRREDIGDDGLVTSSSARARIAVAVDALRQAGASGPRSSTAGGTDR